MFQNPIADAHVCQDTNCVTTIIPVVTDEFNSLNDVGWYGAAFLLASASSQLFYGKIYRFFPSKIVFTTVISLFEIGSLVCALSRNSVTFIVGRAISGLGSAGILTGSNIIISRVVPLRRRPVYLSVIGAIECFAISIGPLLGGVLTDYASWRWCFWISLPIGGATIFVTLVFFHVNEDKEQKNLAWRQKLGELDFLSMAVFVPAIICLVLVLQWGGTRYGWSNVRIIVLVILTACLMIAFVIVQWWKGEKATIPPSIFCTRTILCGTWYSFNTAGALYVAAYYVSVPNMPT